MKLPGAGQGVRGLALEPTPDIGALLRMSNSKLLVLLAESDGEMYATDGNKLTAGKERFEAFIAETAALLRDRAFQKRIHGKDTAVRRAAVVELAVLSADANGKYCAAALVARIGCGACCAGTWANHV